MILDKNGEPHVGAHSAEGLKIEAAQVATVLAIHDWMREKGFTELAEELLKEFTEERNEHS